MLGGPWQLGWAVSGDDGLGGQGLKGMWTLRREAGTGQDVGRRAPILRGGSCGGTVREAVGQKVPFLSWSQPDTLLNVFLAIAVDNLANAQELTKVCGVGTPPASQVCGSGGGGVSVHVPLDEAREPRGGPGPGF